MTTLCLIMVHMPPSHQAQGQQVSGQIGVPLAGLDVLVRVEHGERVGGQPLDLAVVEMAHDGRLLAQRLDPLGHHQASPSRARDVEGNQPVARGDPTMSWNGSLPVVRNPGYAPPRPSRRPVVPSLVPDHRCPRSSARCHDLAIAVALLVLGCQAEDESPFANEAAAACVADNHPSDGHGWQSDEATCTQGPIDPSPSECPPATPQSVADECEAAGVSCNPDAFITRDAALCIARAEGLEEGLLPWTADLIYSERLERPAWGVTSTLEGAPHSCYENSLTMVIDAETGEVLDQIGLIVSC